MVLGPGGGGTHPCGCKHLEKEGGQMGWAPLGQREPEAPWGGKSSPGSGLRAPWGSQYMCTVARELVAPARVATFERRWLDLAVTHRCSWGERAQEHACGGQVQLPAEGPHPQVPYHNLVLFYSKPGLVPFLPGSPDCQYTPTASAPVPSATTPLFSKDNSR